jgi:HPt (histidine-containing phosphotransfer) domain-containing protein
MSASRNLPSVDLQAALERFGGSRAILAELVAMSRTDARKLIETIRQGIESRDFEAVSRAAHNLQGLALNLDAAPTVATARAVEQAADESDGEAATAALAGLEAELAAMLAALDSAPIA